MKSRLQVPRSNNIVERQSRVAANNASVWILRYARPYFQWAADLSRSLAETILIGVVVVVVVRRVSAEVRQRERVEGVLLSV